MLRLIDKLAGKWLDWRGQSPAERVKELEEIVETFEDKPFFDILAEAVIMELRRQRDAMREALQRLLEDYEGMEGACGTVARQARAAMSGEGEVNGL